MEQSDGYRYTAFLVHDGILQCRDTGVVREMSLRHGRCVVDDHIRVVKKALDDVHRVLW